MLINNCKDDTLCDFTVCPVDPLPTAQSDYPLFEPYIYDELVIPQDIRQAVLQLLYTNF